VATLHKMRLTVESGDSAEQVVERAAPPVHFSRKPLVLAALKAWTSARLEQTMKQLAEVALDIRELRTPIDGLAEPLAQRALLSIAVNARRKG
jgi:DNA polymerase-3 subunit delta